MGVQQNETGTWLVPETRSARAGKAARTAADVLALQYHHSGYRVKKITESGDGRSRSGVVKEHLAMPGSALRTVDLAKVENEDRDVDVEQNFVLEDVAALALESSRLDLNVAHQISSDSSQAS